MKHQTARKENENIVLRVIIHTGIVTPGDSSVFMEKNHISDFIFERAGYINYILSEDIFRKQGKASLGFFQIKHYELEIVSCVDLRKI